MNKYEYLWSAFKRFLEEEKTIEQIGKIHSTFLVTAMNKFDELIDKKEEKR